VTSTQTAGTLTVVADSTPTTNIVSSVDTTVTAANASANLNIGGVGNYTITGAGTLALSVNEAATHTTGTLTVTSAGSAALTIVENASGLGAVTINTAGTGTVSLAALSTHTSHTINLSNTGTTTLLSGTTSLANTINTTSVTNHTFLSAATVNSVETYIGSSSIDDVTLGLGADRFTTGGGADVFRTTITTGMATDTGIVSGFASGVALPAQGTAINATGLDIITVTGTAAAFSIVLQAGTASTTYTAGAASLIVRNSGAALGDGTSNSMAAMNGSYSSSTGLFTISNAGSDTLLVYDDNGQIAAGNYRGIVLVGYVDTGGADTFTMVSSATVGTATFQVVL
jgi:hypothetical protein